MRKIFLPILYIALLLALFFLAYSFAKQLKPGPGAPTPAELADFSTNEATLGEVGGLHYLRSSWLENAGGFVRLVIETKLNRPSVIEEQIATPKTIVTQGEERGRHYLLIDMADTTNIYSEEGAREDLYSGLRGDVVNYPPITEIEVLPATEGGQQIKLWLDASPVTGFRALADPTEPGYLWIDVARADS